MSARRRRVGGLLAVAVAAAAIAIVVGRGGGRDGGLVTTADDATSEAESAARPWSPPSPRPTLAGFDDEAQVAAAAAPAPTDAVGYAASLADRLCACADGACLDEVNRHYGGQLGQVGVSHDTRALHDAFARARGCTERIRAAAP